MNKAEFYKQILRLKQVYGDQTYPNECIGALWEELGHVSQERFSKTVTRILADNVSSKYPPGVTKIEKTLALIREEKIEKDREELSGEVSMKELSRGMSALLKEIV
jgi:hypothetical protein